LRHFHGGIGFSVFHRPALLDFAHQALDTVSEAHSGGQLHKHQMGELIPSAKGAGFSACAVLSFKG